MVTDMVRYENILRIAEREGKPKEFIAELLKLKSVVLMEKEKRKRQPRPPAPAGGISIRAASRKYNIANTTIQQWVNKGYIPTLPSSSVWEKFIDEARVAELANAYHSNPGRGTWAVKKLVDADNGGIKANQ